MLYGFDLLKIDGEDLRALPLGDRKKRLARLLARRQVGIVLSEHTADDGATIFQEACRMGLEGIVSKKLSAPYRSGPSRDWLRTKLRDAMHSQIEKPDHRNEVMGLSFQADGRAVHDKKNIYAEVRRALV